MPDQETGPAAQATVITAEVYQSLMQAISSALASLCLGLLNVPLEQLLAFQDEVISPTLDVDAFAVGGTFHEQRLVLGCAINLRDAFTEATLVAQGSHAEAVGVPAE